MDAELKRFEEELERLAPAGMPDGMIARMEAAMEGWQAREEPAEKVVPFPGWKAGEDPSRKRRFWAAAAAVAILGASAALLVPSGGPARTETARGLDAPSLVMEESFAPMKAHRNIINASDEGVVMTNDARPHRAVALQFVDRIEFQNEAGAQLRIEALPKVRIVLIPVQTD